MLRNIKNIYVIPKNQPDAIENLDIYCKRRLQFKIV